MRSISAGKFKDTCLRILDEVAATRIPVVITKWNRPVARLTPLLAPLPPPEPETAADGLGEGTPSLLTASLDRGGGLEAATSRLHRVASQLGMSPEGLLHQALDIYDGDPRPWMNSSSAPGSRSGRSGLIARTSPRNTTRRTWKSWKRRWNGGVFPSGAIRSDQLRLRRYVRVLCASRRGTAVPRQRDRHLASIARRRSHKTAGPSSPITPSSWKPPRSLQADSECRRFANSTTNCLPGHRDRLDQRKAPPPRHRGLLRR